MIEPFVRHPKLLEILVNAIKTEQGHSIRREVIKVLGIVGALDPNKHKTIQIEVRSEKSEESSSGTTNQPSIDSLPGLGSEEYYLTVSVRSLMTILRDPSLSQVRHHYPTHYPCSLANPHLSLLQ